jgi:PhzF family phenazine biosynthesis protein
VEGAALMAPFLVALGGETEAGDVFSRLLMAPPLPAEDPFTGAATGCMGAYLWAEGLIERPRFTAEQGHWMGRPGMARVEVLGPRDDIRGVKVSGRGVVLMTGELLV